MSSLNHQIKASNSAAKYWSQIRLEACTLLYRERARSGHKSMKWWLPVIHQFSFDQGFEVYRWPKMITGNGSITGNTTVITGNITGRLGNKFYQVHFFCHCTTKKIIGLVNARFDSTLTMMVLKIKWLYLKWKTVETSRYVHQNSPSISTAAAYRKLSSGLIVR